MEFLDKLPELPVETTASNPPEEAPVEEIEEKVMAAFAAQPVEEAPAQEEKAEAPAADDYPEGDPFADEQVSEPTRRINLSDLKFGRTYPGED